MHLDRPFGEAAVPVFTWTNQLPFAAQSNQATRALVNKTYINLPQPSFARQIWREIGRPFFRVQVSNLKTLKYSVVEE